MCVASHYTVVQNNSSFMFKYSIFYKPETVRMLTVLVQVSTLDNILMYSYVHNICLYCSLPCWRNINFCFICFILGRPCFQSHIKDWAMFTADFHCFLQTLCANGRILSQIMQWTLTSTPVLTICLLSSHQSTLYNMRYWKHYYRNDK